MGQSLAAYLPRLKDIRGTSILGASYHLGSSLVHLVQRTLIPSFTDQPAPLARLAPTGTSNDHNCDQPAPRIPSTMEDLRQLQAYEDAVYRSIYAALAAQHARLQAGPAGVVSENEGAEVSEGEEVGGSEGASASAGEEQAQHPTSTSTGASTGASTTASTGASTSTRAQPPPPPPFVYEDAVSLSTSVFNDITELIIHACGMGPEALRARHFSGFSSDTDRSYSPKVRALGNGSIFGMYTPSHVLLAFPPVLVAGSATPAQLRLALHVRFAATWNSILAQTIASIQTADAQERPGGIPRDFIFCGFGTGAALATLAAWSTALYLAAGPDAAAARACWLNRNNRVKLVTWEEVPVFTAETSSLALLRDRNHYALRMPPSFRHELFGLLYGSAAIVDDALFASTHNVVTLHEDTFVQGLLAAQAAAASPSATINWAPFSALVQPPAQATRALGLVHLHALAAFEVAVAPAHLANVTVNYLAQPRAAARHLADSLALLFRLPAPAIDCAPIQLDPRLGVFNIICHWDAHPRRPPTHLLTFTAKMDTADAARDGNPCGVFDRAHNLDRAAPAPPPAPTEPRPRRGTARRPRKDRKGGARCRAAPVDQGVVNAWSCCLNALFSVNLDGNVDQATDLRRLLLPFIYGADGHAYPSCSFLGLPGSHRGLYLRPRDIGPQSMKLYKDNRAILYQAIRPLAVAGLPFPGAQCAEHLEPLMLPRDALDALGPLHRHALAYMRELLWPHGLFTSTVHLWDWPAATPRFDTLNFYHASYERMSAISDRSGLPLRYDHCFVNYLSHHQSAAIYDCTDPVNLWIPGYCPAFCQHAASSEASRRFCRHVQSCNYSGFFVMMSELAPWELSTKRVEDKQARTPAANPLRAFAEHLNTLPKMIFSLYHVKPADKDWLGRQTEFYLAIVNIDHLRGADDPARAS